MQHSAAHRLDLDEPSILAISGDGGIVVHADGEHVRVRGGAVLAERAGVAAVAIVEGAIWIVVHAGTGHALARFDLGGSAIGAPTALGDLGSDVEIAAARVGARHALIEGTRAIHIREDQGAMAITELGPRTADRRILLAGRGVLERRGQNLVNAPASGVPTIVLPVDLAVGVVRSGALVLEGAAAMLEVEARGKRQLLVFDARRGNPRSRIRLGDATVAAVAERRGLVVLARGAHLAMLDLHAGVCTNERIFPAPVLAVAIDADGTRVIVDDGTALHTLGATLTEIGFASGGGADEPVAAEPAADEGAEPTAEREIESTESATGDAPLDEPERVLAADEQAQYLDDLYELVTSLCLARSVAVEQMQAGSLTARVQASLDLEIAPGERTQKALERFAAWNRTGAPHAELAAELELSPTAISILVTVAAPQLWSEVARAYAALADRGRALVDESLVADLLAVERTSRGEIARELADDAPLIRLGLVARGEGTRAFASLSVADGVVARLRGEAGVLGGEAAIARIADPVPTVARWESLVVPDDIEASLRELVARIRMRDTVLDQWGLAPIARARGVTALFRGGPGTGKSLAASVIAGALGLPLYRVDLSRVMSKWIGETERSLGAVLDAAEAGKMVILFDEADSLFGKRTKVESSNDRYANLEVNYLLQRLDRFDGIAILTTNHGTSIDPAFQRRMTLELQFPSPDAGAREKLWRAHLPPSVPTEGDLGFAHLAQTYELSGGYIRNAALRACFLAAGAGTKLRAEHLVRAVELEYLTRGKLAATGAL